MAVGRHEEAVAKLQEALQKAGPAATDIRSAIAQAKQHLKQQRAKEGEGRMHMVACLHLRPSFVWRGCSDVLMHGRMAHCVERVK